MVLQVRDVVGEVIGVIGKRHIHEQFFLIIGNQGDVVDEAKSEQLALVNEEDLRSRMLIDRILDVLQVCGTLAGRGYLDGLDIQDPGYGCKKDDEQQGELEESTL